ncbi:ORFL247C [Human betaherpesvirus 5]|nr:ORFL247C [Human betaherpesvirus 5]QHX40618.1 ORFL247C [Human betaherpesvirus 5]
MASESSWWLDRQGMSWVSSWPCSIR